MRTKLRLTRTITLGAAMAALLGLTLAPRCVVAKEVAANDCLVGVLDESKMQLSGTVACTDCDPTCDTDGVTTANGTCTFSIQGCLNIPGVAGCEPRALKKFKFKTQNAKNLIVVNNPTGAGSVCGAFVGFDVNLKKKGKKPGKRTVIATAQADVKPAKKNKDKDKAVFMCNPRPEGEACPTTTTTTTSTTTSTTTTTIPTCGDGTINGTEQCDPAANPIGCSGNDVCVPGGEDACKCLLCTVNAGSPTRLDFTTGTNVTAFCGGQFLEPEADAPITGSVTVRDLINMTDKTLDLGAGCLYVGGGASTVPGGATPDGSLTKLEVDLLCPNDRLVLGPFDNPSDPLNMLSCTKGAGPGKSCVNDLSNLASGTPLPTCTDDTQCNNVVGACVETPNCLFGPPLPIANGSLSTCVVNTFGTNANGSVDKLTGEANLKLPLRSHTYITSNAASPCPTCEGGMCSFGARAGLSCTNPIGTKKVTIECPPSGAGGAYLPEFSVTLDPLATKTSTKMDAGGIFCPGQGLNPTDSAPGAAGTNKINTTTGALTSVATAVTETGSPGGDLSDLMQHDATIASVFCIPKTGNALIDGAASLPGPGAVSLPGKVQLQ